VVGTSFLMIAAVLAQTPSRAEIDTTFQQQLMELAQLCEEHQLADQAKLTRGWLVSQSKASNLLFLVPESDAAKPDSDAPELVQFWYRRFRQLRNQYADALFDHAKQIVQRESATAYRLLHEILRQNPDHPDARRILGYRSVNETWRRPGVTNRAKQPRYHHPKFGWQRGSFWQIDTPHFEIMTNSSQAAGMELGERLEIVYSAWEQLFFEYWSNTAQLAHYFEGAAPSPARKKFQVVYFDQRSQYVDYLTQIAPRAGITLGLYQFNTEQVFLYRTTDTDAQATWHHEVTHQLFQEYRSAEPSVGQAFHGWAVEGPALYMESLRIHDGYVTVGGIDSSRLQFARDRLFVGNFFVPLEELASLGLRSLQQDERITAIYSQAAGFSHFLMDGENQTLRRPFIQFLEKLYQRDTSLQTLQQLSGKPAAELDASYQQFLVVTDAQIEALPEGSPAKNLSLAYCPVSDRSMARIGTLEQLEWLDLSHTSVTSQGVQRLKGCRRLRDLSLSSTAIDDQCLDSVAQLRALQELDLSATKITDEGIGALSKLPNLKILRLAVTNISYNGIVQLKSMDSLKVVDLRRSKLEPAGARRLQQEMPTVQVVTEEM